MYVEAEGLAGTQLRTAQRREAAAVARCAIAKDGIDDVEWIPMHEAGHAVAAVASGLRVKRATVRELDGQVDFTGRRLERAVVLLAGALAEVAARGADFGEIWGSHHLSGDRRSVEALELTGSEIDTAIERAMTTLALHRHAVRRVADALHSRGSLDHEQLRALVYPPCMNQARWIY